MEARLENISKRNHRLTNTQITIRNSIIAVSVQMIALLLGFINRRVFVMFLSVDYLGYHSLFANIFIVLSSAEMGFGAIIHFHLYKAIAENNEEEIGALMRVLQLYYRFVATFVATIGTLTGAFIKVIVRNPDINWTYIYLIYYIQLAGVIAGFILSYRRSIFICDQKEQVCASVDLIMNICFQLLQILVLVITKNYIVYLIITIMKGVLGNLIIFRAAGLRYSYIKRRYSINLSFLKGRNILLDLKNNLIHKVSFAVYSGTDNIVLSSFSGIHIVALYGNYYVVSSSLLAILLKLYSPIQVAIGRVIYSQRNKEDIWNQFKMLELLGYFIASVFSLGMLIFYQFLIDIWLGNEYRLPDSFVIAYVITIYLTLDMEMVYRYRAAFGNYRFDKYYMVVSMILNIVISIILAPTYGATGVQVGTLVAFMPIAVGRAKFVLHGYFEKSQLEFWLDHTFKLFVFLIMGMLSYRLTNLMTISVWGFTQRCLIWMLLAFITNILIFCHFDSFKMLVSYLKNSIHF